MARPDPTPVSSSGAGDERLELLTFEVAGQRLALPLSHVREVLRAVAITPLPEAPAVIEGVVDIRGAVVPVVDVRGRVGLPRRPLELEDRLIVVEAGGRRLALRVDAVHWMVEVDARTVESTREIAPEAFFVAGLARLPDGLVLIYDLERFLSPGEARELARALGLHEGDGPRT